jgi:hypothetical protein
VPRAAGHQVDHFAVGRGRGAAEDVAGAGFAVEVEGFVILLRGGIAGG